MLAALAEDILFVGAVGSFLGWITGGRANVALTASASMSHLREKVLVRCGGAEGDKEGTNPVAIAGCNVAASLIAVFGPVDASPGGRLLTDKVSGTTSSDGSLDERKVSEQWSEGVSN